MYEIMNECNICLEEDDNDIIHFKHHECNFKAHEKCICIWLMNTERCPICRNKINVTHYALHDNIYIFIINDYTLENNDYEITYPYNKIMYEEDMKNDMDKLKSYGIFHWLQIGVKVFRLVQNPNLITYKAPKHYRFCAGTMFWIDAKLLINFFKKHIHFDSYNTFFEKGYFKNDTPTFTHAWERLFALIIHIKNKKLIKY